jgi:two-component system cell cycle sensor histidine kinase/response regulator CckA
MIAVDLAKKVLFVDDDDVIVMLATKTLKRVGVDVDSFTDPRAAVDSFALAPDDDDIVVSDVRLGEVDAFDMCGELLRIRPHLHIILTSGLVRPEDVDRAHALGIGEVLSKSHVMTRLPELLARLRV